MKETFAEAMERYEEQVGEYAENTIGDEMFVVRGVVDGFLAASNISQSDPAYWGAHWMVTRATRNVLRETWADGAPVYMWTGSGGYWQRTDAMSDETLDRLDHMELAHVDARLRRHNVVLVLKAR